MRESLGVANADISLTSIATRGAFRLSATGTPMQAGRHRVYTGAGVAWSYSV